MYSKYPDPPFSFTSWVPKDPNSLKAESKDSDQAGHLVWAHMLEVFAVDHIPMSGSL